MREILRLLVENRARRLKEAEIGDDAFVNGNGGFAPYYREKILPHVREFEEKRLDALSTLRAHVLIAVPLALAGIGLMFTVGFFRILDMPVDVYVFLSLAMAGGLGYWTAYPILQYKKSVKDRIYPLIFGYLGPDYTYSQNSPLKVSSFRVSGIIPSYDNENTGDYVQGTYKGVPLQMVEAKLTATRGTGKDKREETVFKGIFVLVAANKKFKGQTVIRKDYGFMNWAVNGFEKLERVRLEDPEFEKMFEVFGSDQVEARYLLTTSFMERLKKLGSIFDAPWIECSFYGNRLLIMIPTDTNYFETASIFEPATFIEEINRVLTEMKTLFDIIDTLKLDEKTGL